MNTPAIDIARRLTVVSVVPRGGKTWIAECSELPEGSSCELVHRTAMDLVPLKPLKGWVLLVEEDECGGNLLRQAERNESEVDLL